MTLADIGYVSRIDGFWSLCVLIFFVRRTIFWVIKSFDGYVLFFTNHSKVMLVEEFLKVFFLHLFLISLLIFQLVFHLLQTLFKNELVIFLRSFLGIRFVDFIHYLVNHLRRLVDYVYFLAILSFNDCLKNKFLVKTQWMNERTIQMICKDCFKSLI